MRRFPKHARLPFLQDSKVKSEETDPVTGVKTILRTCFIDIEAPSFVKKAAGVDVFEFNQVTTIDPKKRYMKMTSTNETWKEKLSITEGVELYCDPELEDRTHFKQNALLYFIISVPAGKQIQKIIMKSYEKNIEKGKGVDLAFIKDVVNEGGEWVHFQGRTGSNISEMEIVTASNQKNIAELPYHVEGPHILKLILSMLTLYFIPQIVVGWIFSPIASYHFGLCVVLLFAFLMDNDLRKSYMGLLGITINLEEIGLDDFFDPNESLKFIMIPYAVLFTLPELNPWSFGTWQASTAYVIGFIFSLAILSFHGIFFADIYKRYKLKPSSYDNEASSNSALEVPEIGTVNSNTNSESTGNINTVTNFSNTTTLDEKSKKNPKREKTRNKFFGGSTASKKAERAAEKAVIEKQAISEKKNITSPEEDIQKNVLLKGTSSKLTSNDVVSTHDIKSPDASLNQLESENVGQHNPITPVIMNKEETEQTEKLVKLLTKNRILNKSLHDTLNSSFRYSLKGLVLTVPCFILRLVKGEYYMFYTIQLQWQEQETTAMQGYSKDNVIDKDSRGTIRPVFGEYQPNKTKWHLETVEKLYKEFPNLSKSFQKIRETYLQEFTNSNGAAEGEANEILPPEFEEILLPSRKKEKDVYVAYLESQRKSLEFYLQTTVRKLSDEGQISVASGLAGRALNAFIDFMCYDTISPDQFDVNLEPTSVVSMDNGSTGDAANNSFIRPSLSGCMTLANWRHHWQDYNFILDAKHCAFYKAGSNKDKIKFKIPIDWIKNIVEIVPSMTFEKKKIGISVVYPNLERHFQGEMFDGRPFSSSYFLRIQVECLDTLEYTLAFKQRSILDRFLEYLKKSLLNLSGSENAYMKSIRRLSFTKNLLESDVDGKLEKDENLEAEELQLDIEKIYNPVSGGYSHCLLGGGSVSAMSSLNANWSKKECYILNKRIILFSSISEQRLKFSNFNYGSDLNNTKNSKDSCPFGCPGKMSEYLLNQILNIYQKYLNNGKILNAELAKELLIYSLKTASLTCIGDQLKNCTEDEKLVFFLNIYHALILHAYLEFGQPTSFQDTDSSLSSAVSSEVWKTLSMRKFLAFTCYDIGGFVYSLLFLEHSILRGNSSSPMIYPGNFFFGSKSLDHLKKSVKDPRRRWTPFRKVEPRISFILGMGTMSGPSRIWVFSLGTTSQCQIKTSNEFQKKSITLDEELLHASGHYLIDQIQISFKDPNAAEGSVPLTVLESGAKCLIQLPKIVQFFYRDFVSTASSAEVAPLDKRILFESLLPFFPHRFKQYLVSTHILLVRSDGSTSTNTSANSSLANSPIATHSPYLGIANEAFSCMSGSSTDTLNPREEIITKDTPIHFNNPFEDSTPPNASIGNLSTNTGGGGQPAHSLNPLKAIKNRYRQSTAKDMAAKWNKSSLEDFAPSMEPNQSSAKMNHLHSGDLVCSDNITIARYILAPNVKIKFLEYNWSIRQEFFRGHPWSASCNL